MFVWLAYFLSTYFSIYLFLLLSMDPTTIFDTTHRSPVLFQLTFTSVSVLLVSTVNIYFNFYIYLFLILEKH